MPTDKKVLSVSIIDKDTGKELIGFDRNLSTLSTLKEEVKIKNKRTKESAYMNYGIVKESTTFTLWFESITDTLDGFVVRDNSGNILEVYPFDK